MMSDDIPQEEEIPIEAEFDADETTKSCRHILIERSGDDFYIDSIPINYCPQCGIQVEQIGLKKRRRKKK